MVWPLFILKLLELAQALYLEITPLLTDLWLSMNLWMILVSQRVMQGADLLVVAVAEGHVAEALVNGAGERVSGACLGGGAGGGVRQWARLVVLVV